MAKQSAAMKRLMRDVVEVEKWTDEWAGAEPLDGNLFHWRGIIIGPENTPYAGGLFGLELLMPENYPDSAPKVKFTTPILHPSVKKDTGEICQDMITEAWTKESQLIDIFHSLKYFLEHPGDTDTPVESELFNLLSSDKNAYEARVRAHTDEFSD